VTGYHRPITNWNAGKRQEFDDRKMFNLDNKNFKVKFSKEGQPIIEKL